MKKNVLKGGVQSLTEKEILQESVFQALGQISDPLERERMRQDLQGRARELHKKREFDRLYQLYEQKGGNKGGNITAFPDCPVGPMQCGQWTADEHGVRRKDGLGTAWACRHPILPTARLLRKETGQEKLELSFYKDGAWKTVVAERSLCASKVKIVALADRGIEVTTENARYLVQYIADMVHLAGDSLPLCNAAPHIGWIGAQFSPFDGDIRFDGDACFQPLLQDYSSKGAFSDWRVVCHGLRANKLLRFAMAASFASALLERVGALPFVFHLWGGTGTGKTVALMAAMSIWGNPALGKLVRSLNMTVNSMAEYASFLHSIPFAGDELQTVKDRFGSYDNMVMHLTEGVNRSRLTSGGVMQENKTWKCSFLFTGEEPITRESSGGGVKNRVIEAEVTEQLISDGSSVSSFLRDHYGGAGKVFVAYIRTMDVRPRYQALLAQLLQRDTTEKQAMAMACILLADQLSCECIFQGETPLTCQDAEPLLCKKAEVDVANRAYEYTVGLIARNPARFTKNGNNGELWGRIEGSLVTINQDVLKEALAEEGYSLRAVYGAWFRRGQILKNSQGKYVHYTAVAGVRAGYLKIRLDRESVTDPKPDESVPF